MHPFRGQKTFADFRTVNTKGQKLGYNDWTGSINRVEKPSAGLVVDHNKGFHSSRAIVYANPHAAASVPPRSSSRRRRASLCAKIFLRRTRFSPRSRRVRK